MRRKVKIQILKIVNQLIGEVDENQNQCVTPKNPDNLSMLLNAVVRICAVMSSLGDKGRIGLVGCKTVALVSYCSQIL